MPVLFSVPLTLKDSLGYSLFVTGKSAAEALAVPLAGGPNSVKDVAYRLYCDRYCVWAVWMVRMD